MDHDPMNFYLVGNLLAVSLERGTAHVFKLGSGQQVRIAISEGGGGLWCDWWGD